MLLGIVIGGCALVIFDRFRRVRMEEDADAIAERLAQRLHSLEAKMHKTNPTQAAVHA